MENRDAALLALRGPHIGSILPNASSEEIFQNSTLRPILKLQNDLFIASFQNYIEKHKIDFYLLNIEKKFVFMDTAIQKDIKFRNALKGMVIALFTLEEFEQYIQNSSSLNKRMMNMLLERLKSQIQLFDR